MIDAPFEVFLRHVRDLQTRVARCPPRGPPLWTGSPSRLKDFAWIPGQILGPQVAGFSTPAGY